MAYQRDGLSNAKVNLEEGHKYYYSSHSWVDKGGYTFSEGISPKVNVIARLELEFALYNVTVQYFTHFATETPPFLQIGSFILKFRRYKEIIFFVLGKSWFWFYGVTNTVDHLMLNLFLYIYIKYKIS